MKAMGWRAAGLVSAAVLIAPAMVSADSREEYVPRAEYEALKQEVAELRQTLQRSIAQPGAREAGASTSSDAAHQKSITVLPGGTLTPGWKRARAANWMNPDAYDKMDARIAEVGDMTLFMGLDTVGRFQYLTQDDDTKDTVGTSSVEPGPLTAGFQTAYGNLSFLADFNQAFEVYFDLFIADAPHPDKLQGDEGFILVRHVPGSPGEIGWVRTLFDYVDVKAGQFEVDFGDTHYLRSTNAKVQRNSLIGNYVVDPRSTDIGMEIMSDEGVLPVNWLVGVGDGSDTGDFEDNRGWQLHGKLWGNPLPQLRTSASVTYVDHSDNTTATRTNLFRSNRTGSSYAGVLDNGSAAGDVVMGGGQRQFATQADVYWTAGRNESYGHVGYFTDRDVNGSSNLSPAEEWLYYGAEARHNFTDRLYTALRYSGAAALQLVSRADSSLDVNSNGFVHRLQLGGGYWITPTVLAKLEYVHQLYRGFDSAGAQVSGVDVWDDPYFTGLISEVSFAF